MHFSRDGHDDVRGDVYVRHYDKKYIHYSMDDDTLLEVHNSDAHTLREA